MVPCIITASQGIWRGGHIEALMEKVGTEEGLRKGCTGDLGGHSRQVFLVFPRLVWEERYEQ